MVAAGECGSTECQNIRYQELIVKLRTQLRELENFAHQEGASGPLDASLAEKQVIVIEELVRRFDLQFGDLDQLSTEELRESVDKAIHKVVTAKEEMVGRLQTQIQDLERYIQFLQESPHETSSTGSVMTEMVEPKRKRVSFADSPMEGGVSRDAVDGGGVSRYRMALDELQAGSRKLSVMDPVLAEWETKASRGKPYDPEQIGVLMMKKTLTIMQVLTLWQCGGRLNCLPKYANLEKKRLRYQLGHIAIVQSVPYSIHLPSSRTALQSLELAVNKVSLIANALNQPDVSDEVVQLETDLHEAVSMNLADPLRLLLEHGLQSNQYTDQPTACIPMWSNVGCADDGKDCGAWKVIMHYYRLKGGDDLCSKPEQMLLLSFSLQPEQCSLKKTLLAAVHKVEKNFDGCYVKSPDTKFRALICEGFNQGHLAEWFRIIATHPSIADDLYCKSSFLASTRFRPALACLERLKDIGTCGPVELPMGYYQGSEAFF
eukprot:Em0017g32a